MAVLRVRRPSAGKRELLFQGVWLPVGTQVDTRDFPRVTRMPGKWAQLIQQGWFHDDHLSGDLAVEVQARRDQYGSEPVVESRPDPVIPIDRPTPLGPAVDERDAEWIAATLDKPDELQCGACGYRATSQRGLGQHKRSHTTKE